MREIKSKLDFIEKEDSTPPIKEGKLLEPSHLIRDSIWVNEKPTV